MRCSFNGVNLNLNCVDGGLVKNKTKTKDGGYAGGVYAGGLAVRTGGMQAGYMQATQCS